MSGLGFTVKAALAVSAVAESFTVTVYPPGAAVFETAKYPVMEPSVDMEQYTVGLVANRPVRGWMVQLRAADDVVNPPPTTATLPEPSVGRVPNPGAALVGFRTIVGVLTTQRNGGTAGVLPVAPVTMIASGTAPAATTVNDVVVNKPFAPTLQVKVPTDPPDPPVIVHGLSPVKKPAPVTVTVCPTVTTLAESEMVWLTVKAVAALVSTTLPPEAKVCRKRL
jgi:hypothetical protein